MSAALTYKGQKSREFFTMNDDQVSALFQDLDGIASSTEGRDSSATHGSAPAATEAKDSSGSGTNTGAIVGGVVGGVGAVALAAVATLLFLRLRKKRKGRDGSPPAYEPAPSDDNTNNKEALQSGEHSPSNGALAIHEAEVKDKPQELADNGSRKEPVELA